MQTNIDRAKQFLPFAALKGFEEALRKKEQQLESIPKYSLSDDRIEDITNKLNNINHNSIINIKYFNNNKYINIKGYITKIDNIYKYLIINNKKINFNDILKIDINNN